MHFDVLFLDVTANKYYDRMELEKHPLGGTEASVVRVAEGLASFGLKVAVVQSRVPFFEPTMGQHCFFLHSDSLPDITCRHYVQLRQNKNPHLFKDSKKYLWLHDVVIPERAEWLDSIKENKISIVTVSDWHRKNAQDIFKDYLDISYIYNPVPDEIYINKDTELKYDRNLMVWMSSPHKGLNRALELFKEVKEKQPKMNLIVMHPGYTPIESTKIFLMPGVSVYGALSCRDAWNVLSKSLCIFYPTDWQETFGCIAAEANALGVPIATFKNAGLAESVSTEEQFATDDKDLVAKVVHWSTEGRPKVEGQEGFKFGNVILNWLELLGR